MACSWIFWAGGENGRSQGESTHTRTTWTTTGRCITHHHTVFPLATSQSSAEWSGQNMNPVRVSCCPLAMVKWQLGDFHFACLTLRRGIFPRVTGDYRETFDMAGLSPKRRWPLLCPLCRTPLRTSPPGCSLSSFFLLVCLVKAFKKLPSSVRGPPACPFPLLCPSKSPRGQKHLSFRQRDLLSGPPFYLQITVPQGKWRGDQDEGLEVLTL